MEPASGDEDGVVFGIREVSTMPYSLSAANYFGRVSRAQILVRIDQANRTHTLAGKAQASELIRAE